MAATRDDWRALYEAVEAFRTLAPWRVMLDSDVFGVRDPRTGAIAWVSVLGNAGKFEGLAAYRSQRGFDLFRRMHIDPPNVEDEAVYGQDAMVLAFGGRDDLNDVERARLRALKLTFRGRGAWPLVQSHEPGRLPLPLDDAEVGFFTDVLRQACVVAERFALDASCLDRDAVDRLLVRACAAPGSAEWHDERVIEPDPLPLVTPPFDQLRVEKLRRALRRSDIELECDVFPAATVIDDGKRPAYLPSMFMLADARIGVVHRFHIGEPLQRVEFAQTEFLAAIEALGMAPARVKVAREEVARALAGIVDALGLQLVAADELPCIDHAREHLEALFSDPVGRRGPSRAPRR